MEYSLRPRAKPEECPDGSGYISLYILTGVTIQTFSITTPALSFLEIKIRRLILRIAPTAGQYGKIRLINTADLNFNIIIFCNWEWLISVKVQNEKKK